MKSAEIIYTGCTIVLSVFGIVVSIVLYGQSGMTGDRVTTEYDVMYDVIHIGFTLPSVVVLVLAILHVASGRLRPTTTRIQASALCCTIVGIPLATWGIYLARRQDVDRQSDADLANYYRAQTDDQS